MKTSTQRAALSVAVASGLLIGATMARGQSPSEADGPSAQTELDAILNDVSPVDEAVSVPEGVAPQPYENTVPLQESSQPYDTPAARSPPRQIEEIVVSARRTEENMQDVPIAVTAMDDDAIKREGIGTMQDLQGRVPSLVMGTNGQQRSTESPTIRGQGATFGGGSGVLLYFADAPLPADTTLNNVGGPGKFVDLQSIQILKGSQGTLFGRNTTGGAIVLQPHKPVNYRTGSLTAEVGNFSGQGLEAVFNTPIIDDTLLLRVGGKFAKRDGFTTDIANGKDYDNRNYWTARLGLTWLPNDRVENYLFVYYSQNDDNGTSVIMRDANPSAINGLIMSQIGLSPLPAVPPELQPGCLAWDVALAREASRCGQLFADEQNARDHRHVQFSGDSEDRLDTGGVINTLSIDLSEELRLRNINSFSFLKHQYQWDFDGTRAEWTDFANPKDVNQANFSVFSEELQLLGNYLSGDLVFALGVYFELQEPIGDESEIIRALYNDVSVEFDLRRKSLGPFAQATYDLGQVTEWLRGLRLTAGARYSKDDIEGRSVFSQSAFGIPSAPVVESGGANDSAVTWTIGADYNVNQQLFYGKVSRGYKTGGFAITAVNPNYLTFKPEFVLNYEVGHKTDFAIAEVPIRLNSAVYYTDYTDLQRNAVDVFTDSSSGAAAPRVGAAVYNAGKASISGFELEATVLPTDRLTLSANYAYTKAEYREYTLISADATGHLSCSGDRMPTGEIVDLACMPFQFTPLHQYSVSALYELPIDPKHGLLSGSATWAWTGRTYTSATTLPEDEPGSFLEPIGLLNASINWTDFVGSKIDVQIFGTNLLDKVYRMGNQNVWNTLGFTASIYGEPRMIGLRLSYSWDT